LKGQDCENAFVVSNWWKKGRLPLVAIGLLLFASGCRSYSPRAIAGDEIIVAGERFHTGTRVVTWHEPRGYNGYVEGRRMVSRPTSLRRADQPRDTDPKWTVRRLGRVVDQFVLHYDACGLSKVCFDVLHARGLSVHFLLDVDGTVYQTIDLQERALHATSSNDRSIGIEIANIGAYPPDAAQPLEQWYRRDPASESGAVLSVPAKITDPRILTPNYVGRPDRSGPVSGIIQGQALLQHDLTPEQYAALAKLTAVLGEIFPKLRRDYPRDENGEVILRKLPDDELARYRGILGHFHIQENKVDPGPAFQWERLIEDVRRVMTGR
jgi:N-acetyl-anhydromuramyl-L-alanine amidase AmpD